MTCRQPTEADQPTSTEETPSLSCKIASWHIPESLQTRILDHLAFLRATLERELAGPASLRHRIFAAYSRLLRARASDPAFHPPAPLRGALAEALTSLSWPGARAWLFFVRSENLEFPP